MQVMVEVETLGGLLKVWRMQTGMSARELAKKASGLLPNGMSVSHTTVTRFELDDAKNPLVLAALTEALGHKLSELPEENQRQFDEVGRLVKRRCSGPVPSAAA